jgi:uncharacterized protein (DUF1684 family)
MIQDEHLKLNPGLPWQKWHSTRRRRLFSPAHWISIQGTNQYNATFGAQLCMVLKLGPFIAWC